MTQAVFAKAAKALPTSAATRTSTWLYRIAANVAADWLRSRSTHEAKVTVRYPEASDEDMGAAATRLGQVDSRPIPRTGTCPQGHARLHPR